MTRRAPGGDRPADCIQSTYLTGLSLEIDAAQPGRRFSFAVSLCLHILCVALLPRLQFLMRQPPHLDAAQYDVVRLDYRVPVSPLLAPPAAAPGAGRKSPQPLQPSSPSAASSKAPQRNRRAAEAPGAPSGGAGEQQPLKTAEAANKERPAERQRYELVLPEFPGSDPALRDIILHPDFQVPLPPEYAPKLPPVVLWSLTPPPLLDGAVLEPAKQERTAPPRWELPPAKPKTPPRPALAASAPPGPALSEPPVVPGPLATPVLLAAVKSPVENPPPGPTPLATPESRHPPAALGRNLEPARKVEAAPPRWEPPPAEPEAQSPPALADVAPRRSPVLSELPSDLGLSPVPPRLAALRPPVDNPPSPPPLAPSEQRSPSLALTRSIEPVRQNRPPPPRWEPPPAELKAQSRPALGDVAPQQSPVLSEPLAPPRPAPDPPRLAVRPPPDAQPGPPALAAVEMQTSLLALTQNLDLLATSFELQPGYRVAAAEPASAASPGFSNTNEGQTASSIPRQGLAVAEAPVSPRRPADRRRPGAAKSALDALAGPPALADGEGRHSLLALSQNLDLLAPSFELQPGYRVGAAEAAGAASSQSSPAAGTGPGASPSGRQSQVQPALSHSSAAPGRRAARAAVDALTGPPSLSGGEGRHSLLALSRTLDLFATSFELQPGYRVGASEPANAPSRESGPAEEGPAGADSAGRMAKSEDPGPQGSKLLAENRRPFPNGNPLPGSQDSNGSENAARTAGSAAEPGGNPDARKSGDAANSGAADPADPAAARGAGSASAIASQGDSASTASPAPVAASTPATSPSDLSKRPRTRRAPGPLRPVPRSRHGIILVSNALATLPEAIGVLTGNPVYAVYLEVPEAPRKWVLQFCVPGAAEARLQFSGGVVRVVPRKDLDPPYALHREPLRLDQAEPARPFPQRAVVYFTLDEEGVMGNLRIIQGGGPRIDRTILANLETWQFLPAFQEGRPVPVEAIFGIPLQ